MVLKTQCQEEEFSFSPSHCLASVSRSWLWAWGEISPPAKSSSYEKVSAGLQGTDMFFGWIPVKFFTNQLSNEVGGSPYQGKK